MADFFRLSNDSVINLDLIVGADFDDRSQSCVIRFSGGQTKILKSLEAKEFWSYFSNNSVSVETKTK